MYLYKDEKKERPTFIVGKKEVKMAEIALCITIAVITTIFAIMLHCKSNEKCKLHMIGKSCVCINKYQYNAFKKLTQSTVNAYVRDGILCVEIRNDYGPGYTAYNIYPNGRTTPQENNSVLSKALNGKVFTI